MERRGRQTGANGMVPGQVEEHASATPAGNGHGVPAFASTKQDPYATQMNANANAAFAPMHSTAPIGEHIASFYAQNAPASSNTDPASSHMASVFASRGSAGPSCAARHHSEPASVFASRNTVAPPDAVRDHRHSEPASPGAVGDHAGVPFVPRTGPAGAVGDHAGLGFRSELVPVHSVGGWAMATGPPGAVGDHMSSLVPAICKPKRKNKREKKEEKKEEDAVTPGPISSLPPTSGSALLSAASSALQPAPGENLTTWGPPPSTQKKEENLPTYAVVFLPPPEAPPLGIGEIPSTYATAASRFELLDSCVKARSVQGTGVARELLHPTASAFVEGGIEGLFER